MKIMYDKTIKDIRNKQKRGG